MTTTLTAIATRGEHLILTRLRAFGADPESLQIEVLHLVQIVRGNQIAAIVMFDPDDIDAAFQELEARYIAGEAAPYAQAWSAVIQTTTAFSRREIPTGTPNSVSIDHRRGTAFAPGELTAYMRATWHLSQQTALYVEAVQRLSSSGAVITLAADATSRDGFSAEWRVVNLFMFEGALVDRCEVFDEADLDSAIARFDDLNLPAPQHQNAASQMLTRFQEVFDARDWNGMAEIFADDICLDDRRPVVGVGFSGRDATVANMRASADVGVKSVTSTVIATRGNSLALHRVLINGRDKRPEAFRTDALVIVEVDAQSRVIAFVMFDLDDIDAAYTELDARYLAGEAAPHANTWRVITQAYAGMTRGELPATVADLVNVDHRRVTPMAPDAGIAYLRASWELAPEFHLYIETVHRLSDLGAVFTRWSKGTSQEGFDAEWRAIDVITVKGDLIQRGEIFDEADLDTALVRFDELSRQAPRLVNTAGMVERHVQEHIAAQNWDAMASLLADDISLDDRRRVVNAGLRRGRDVVIDDLRIGADIGLTEIAATGIAIRGESLTLGNTRYRGPVSSPEASFIEIVQLVEIDAEERIKAIVLFDPDDLDAAYAELDSRYLTGEAAAHAHTWSVILGGYAASNRRELPPTTPDWQTVDHRRAIAFAPGDLARYMHATWEVAPDSRAYAAAVHRLNQFGAVVTQTVKGASPSGFYAEWQEIVVLTVEGDLLNRAELYDEPDLNAALARFEEVSRPAQRLENAATRVFERVLADFRARDWDAMAANLSAEYFQHDRRRVVNAGIRRGRDAEIESFRSAADLGITHFSPSVVATRGERVGLVRARAWGRDQEPGAFIAENLFVVEITAENQAAAALVFDLDNLDAAFTELDSRYVAGEASAHAHTYSVIAGAFAAVNRHELPVIASNLMSIDHRRPIAFAPGELIPYLQATLSDAPEIRIDINAVHRLSSMGAVVTHAWHNTSQQGFDAEWRVIGVSTVDGDLINRCELFDDSDLDAALARFDELSRPAQRPVNAASRLSERRNAYFAARDWNALAETVSDDVFSDDRRRVVSAGVIRGRDAQVASSREAAALGVTTITSTFIAIRGERVALSNTRISGSDKSAEGFYVEQLGVVEIDADERMVAYIVFDVDDMDAAFAELDARYLAHLTPGCAHTWSVIAESFARINRRDLPESARQVVSIDHSHVNKMAPDDLRANILAGWDVVPDIYIRIEAVHRITDVGAVLTWVATGTSREGFEAEWRSTNVQIIDGEIPSRVELFDDSDLDAALARFDELTRPSTRLDNAASQVGQRLRAAFVARDWDALAQLVADDLYNEDRRRVVNGGIKHGRDSMLEDMRAAASMGIQEFATTEIATRGERLALVRASSSYEGRPGAFYVENLAVAEIDAEARIAAQIMFDLDDVDAAFAELDARYLAGEAAAYAGTWSVIAGVYAAFNRDELPSANWVNIDHRRGTPFASSELSTSIRASKELTPDLKVRVEAVHRLGRSGAVITNASYGTSQAGFNAEWRMLQVLMVEGGRVHRCELFDEDDLDAALARFDELVPPTKHLENTASRVDDRIWEAYAARDWTAVAEMLADDHYSDDRRPVVGAGVRRGRDLEIEDMRSAAAEFEPLTRTSVVMAVRGECLALARCRYSGQPERRGAFYTDVLRLIELNANGRIAAMVMFDSSDTDAAFAELESRYIAGEPPDQARTWSAIASSYASLNRHELSPTTADQIHADHRTVVTIAPTDLAETIRVAWDLVPDLSMYIEAVHCINTLGAVVTNRSFGTSIEGFDAEWRMVQLMTVESGRLNRLELFDEADVDAALARLDELSRPTPGFENTATRIWTRLADAFHRRDVDAFVDLTEPDGHFDDRRRGLRVSLDGSMRRRVVQTMFEFPQSWRMQLEHVAVRGSRLSLSRQFYRDADHADRPITVEALTLIECGDDDLVHTFVIFDPDNYAAAFTELDARYVAGEGAAHSHIWTLVNQTYSRFNRHELSPTTPDWVNVDHRRGAAPEPGDMHAYVSAMWAVAPDVHTCIESVHRLTNLGAVFTHSELGTSQQGFGAEWREVTLLTFQGDLIDRCELFDEDALDVAIARFEELTAQVNHLEGGVSQLDNAATRVRTRLADEFNRRDMSAFLALAAADGSFEDRRKGLRDEATGAGLTKVTEALFEVVPTDWAFEVKPFVLRGSRLALTLDRYRTTDKDPTTTAEHLTLTEIDDDGLVRKTTLFDPDDFDAAFQELEMRYIAGEAAAHAHTWSVVTAGFVALCRREVPARTPEWAMVDHRKLTTFAPGDLSADILAMWDLAPNAGYHIETVHRLSDLGAVVTYTASATTKEGFVAEWRAIDLMTVSGDMFSHTELFDETDLDAALARFDELTAPASQPTNAATRVNVIFADVFNQRDLNGVLSAIDANARYEDRRKGLRDEGAMDRDYVRSMFESESAKSWLFEIEPVAIRGHDLALARHIYRDAAEADQPITIELLALTEVTGDELLYRCTLFDPEDLDTAMAELTARWIDSGDVAHPAVIEAACRSNEAYNRHAWDVVAEIEAGATYVNHRQLVGAEPETIEDHWRSIRTLASLIPNMWTEQAEVITHSKTGLLSHVVVKGTTAEGAAIELPAITLIFFDGTRVTRMEAFDIDQRDLAVARFQELSR
jgi:hypothetical protein